MSECHYDNSHQARKYHLQAVGKNFTIIAWRVGIDWTVKDLEWNFVVSQKRRIDVTHWPTETNCLRLKVYIWSHKLTNATREIDFIESFIDETLANAFVKWGEARTQIFTAKFSEGNKKVEPKGNRTLTEQYRYSSAIQFMPYGDASFFFLERQCRMLIGRNLSCA